MQLKRNLFSTLLLIVTIVSVAQTTIVDSIFAGGIYRQYRLYIPSVYNGSTPVPLILNLHGYGSDNMQQEIYGDFRPIADTANFIIVHPNGTYDNFGSRYWNCWTPVGTAPNDVTFLSALIDSIGAVYNIDLQRVYSTGLSNGGFMSSDLACFLSNRITAIASVAAGMGSAHKSSCNPSHSTPVMEVHGTSDAVVPYAGTTGIMHVDSVIKFWVDFNNCNTTAIQNTVTNINTFDGCTADNFLYSNGTAGSSVELYKIYNGGHTWPGAMPIASLGNTCQDFSASKEIWRFFRKYTLTGLTALEEFNQTENISFFPNPSSGKIHIKSGNEIQKIEISDLQGKIHFLEYTNGASIAIDLNLSPGLYLLNVYSYGSCRKKLVCIQ